MDKKVRSFFCYLAGFLFAMAFLSSCLGALTYGTGDTSYYIKVSLLSLGGAFLIGLAIAIDDIGRHFG